MVLYSLDPTRAEVVEEGLRALVQARGERPRRRDRGPYAIVQIALGGMGPWGAIALLGCTCLLCPVRVCLAYACCGTRGWSLYLPGSGHRGPAYGSPSSALVAGGAVI